MDIDMTTLRMLERERDLSLDVLVAAIEQALLSAYHRTPDAYNRARVEVDRASGHVTVWAREELPVDVDPEDPDARPAVELGPESSRARAATRRRGRRGRRWPWRGSPRARRPPGAGPRRGSGRRPGRPRPWRPSR